MRGSTPQHRERSGRGSDTPQEVKTRDARPSRAAHPEEWRGGGEGLADQRPQRAEAAGQSWRVDEFSTAGGREQQHPTRQEPVSRGNIKEDGPAC